jgi:hypothetical protein
MANKHLMICSIGILAFFSISLKAGLNDNFNIPEYKVKCVGKEFNINKKKDNTFNYHKQLHILGLTRQLPITPEYLDGWRTGVKNDGTVEEFNFIANRCEKERCVELNFYEDKLPKQCKPIILGKVSKCMRKWTKAFDKMRKYKFEIIEGKILQIRLDKKKILTIVNMGGTRLAGQLLTGIKNVKKHNRLVSRKMINALSKQDFAAIGKIIASMEKNAEKAEYIHLHAAEQFPYPVNAYRHTAAAQKGKRAAIDATFNFFVSNKQKRNRKRAVEQYLDNYKYSRELDKFYYQQMDETERVFAFRPNFYKKKVLEETELRIQYEFYGGYKPQSCVWKIPKTSGR